MIKNNLIITSIAIICLFLGILIGSIFPTWYYFKTSFYDVKLIEIVQIVVTILIAFFATYFISSKINNNVKKREIASELLLKFQDNLTNVLELGYEYIALPDDIKRKKIVNMFKKASMLLGIIIDVKKKNKSLIKYEESFYEDFLKFKDALTDTPFGQKTPKYSEERIVQLHDNYEVLLKKLYECKINLYSE